MKISHAAYYIIEKYHGIQGGVTPLKLQKLLYYLKVWDVVSGEKLLTNGEFKAWKNGPVNGYIYGDYKKYGSQPIPFKHPAAPVPEEKRKVINFILDSYVHFDALTLSAMTHEELPWKVTSKNETISEELMKEFYSQQPFAKNFPLKDGNPYYPVYSDFIYSFIFDFEEDDAAKEIVFNSFQEYKKLMEQSQSAFDKHFSVESA